MTAPALALTPSPYATPRRPASGPASQLSSPRGGAIGSLERAFGEAASLLAAMRGPQLTALQEMEPHVAAARAEQARMVAATESAVRPVLGELQARVATVEGQTNEYLCRGRVFSSTQLGSHHAATAADPADAGPVHSAADAVAAMQRGDVLRLRAGRYAGPLRVTAPYAQIIGESGTVIECADGGDALSVSAPGVRVVNLRVRQRGGDYHALRVTDTGADAAAVVPTVCGAPPGPAIRIENCTFESRNCAAASVSRSSTAPESPRGAAPRVSFDRCEFHSLLGAACAFRAQSRVQLRDCGLSCAPPQAAPTAPRPSRASAAGPPVVHLHGDGVACRMINCEVTAAPSRAAGIRIEDGANVACALTSCTVKGGCGTGIDASTAARANLTLDRTHVADCSDAGVVVAGCLSMNGGSVSRSVLSNVTLLPTGRVASLTGHPAISHAGQYGLLLLRAAGEKRDPTEVLSVGGAWLSMEHIAARCELTGNALGAVKLDSVV